MGRYAQQRWTWTSSYSANATAGARPYTDASHAEPLQQVAQRCHEGHEDTKTETAVDDTVMPDLPVDDTVMSEPPSAPTGAPVTFGGDFSFDAPLPPPTAGHIICAARVQELEEALKRAVELQSAAAAENLAERNHAEHERLMREMEAKELERQLRSETSAKYKAKEQVDQSADAHAELTWQMNQLVEARVVQEQQQQQQQLQLQQQQQQLQQQLQQQAEVAAEAAAKAAQPSSEHPVYHESDTALAWLADQFRSAFANQAETSAEQSRRIEEISEKVEFTQRTLVNLLKEREPIVAPEPVETNTGRPIAA